MSFSAIKGQDKPIGMLKTYIENSCLEGGYLFAGPEGIGKKMTALALAEELVGSSQHPDVHVISNEDTQIKIDVIRQLQKDINLKAYAGPYKVFIIDNAHTLTPEASNSLLKILEEPPKKSLIILISDKPNLLFKTVISRCKILKFLPLKRTVLEDILRKDYKLDNALAHFLAYFSEGRLGGALKLMDEDIINKKNSLIDKFILAARPALDSFAGQSRPEVRNGLNLLVTWFRDIYLLKSGMPLDEAINYDRGTELTQGARRLSFSDLDMIFGNITAAIAYLEMNVNTRLLIYNLGMELWKV